jgi:predicted DNA-binding protein (MmcQ/YjbR family)
MARILTVCCMYVYLQHSNATILDINSRQASNSSQRLVRCRENVTLSYHLTNSHWYNFREREREKERKVCLTVLSIARIIHYGVDGR